MASEFDRQWQYQLFFALPNTLPSTDDFATRSQITEWLQERLGDEYSWLFNDAGQWRFGPRRRGGYNGWLLCLDDESLALEAKLMWSDYLR